MDGMPTKTDYPREHAIYASVYGVVDNQRLQVQCIRFVSYIEISIGIYIYMHIYIYYKQWEDTLNQENFH